MHDTKTNNGKRTIPLTAKAISALKNQSIQKKKIIMKDKIAPEEYENLIFVTRNNKPTQQFLVKECIDGIVRHIKKDNKEFESLTPHTFRHTFATRAVESEVNPKTLQKFLGHDTLQMTMDLYCHVTEDTMFEEMQKFEQKCS